MNSHAKSLLQSNLLFTGFVLFLFGKCRKLSPKIQFLIQFSVKINFKLIFQLWENKPIFVGFGFVYLFVCLFWLVFCFGFVSWGGGVGCLFFRLVWFG